MSENEKTVIESKVPYISYIVIVIIILTAGYYLYIKYVKNKEDSESDSESDCDEENQKSKKDKKNKDAFNIEEEVASLNKLQAQIITQLQTKNSFGRP